MPKQTKDAIHWALEQKDYFGNKISLNELVDYVRKYFNENGVEYKTFSFADLKPYL